MSSLSDTLAIDKEIQKLNRLRFSPALEAQFDAEGVDHRKRVGPVSLAAGMVMFNAFLLADFTILPDVFHWLVIVRLLIFTPACLLILWAVSRASSTFQIDAMAVAGTCLAVALPTITILFSASKYTLLYQFGSMVTITYYTLVQRVRFRMALAGLLIIVALHLYCVKYLTAMDSISYSFVCQFYLAGSSLLLMGSYIQERLERQGFLERLKSTMLLKHIEWTARTNLLTGLSNRHHLAQVRDQFESKQFEGQIAALMVDIDHFKLFNDTQGHLAGDRCIKAVGRAIVSALDAIRACEGQLDFAFRFGGEEFLILLMGWDHEQAMTLGDAIRRHIHEACIGHPAAGGSGRVTASIGIAVSEAGRHSMDELIGLADAALYKSKQDGRDRLSVAA